MGNIPNRPVRLFAFIFIVIIASLLLQPERLWSAAWAASPQGKGGAIKPVPTPTPAPKKPTPTKKSTPPSRAGRTNASKPASEPEAAKTSAAEIAFWETIRTSTNPEDFREYLKKYPNGEFAGLARNRLSALETAAKEAAAKEEAARKEEDKRKEEEAKKRPGAVVKNSIGMELVYIPAGTFMMGSSDAEAKAAVEQLRRFNDVSMDLFAFEKPKHQVTIREGFYMGRYEVTQAEWQAVMGTNPGNQKDCNQCPVDNVSWNEAQEFIRRMNGRGDGYTYRLPTEAEWEYACRAGTTTAFAFGDSLSSEQANFDGSRPYGAAAKGVSRSKTMPVGSFQPNAWGLYDMHGNVEEWCEDWFHDDYNGAPTDGSAWLSGGKQEFRVVRGGGYANSAAYLRSANRLDPKKPERGAGFRVVAIARTQ